MAAVLLSTTSQHHDIMLSWSLLTTDDVAKNGIA
jgi:hypothetical protein